MRVGITVMIEIEDMKELKEESRRRRITINKLISKIVSEYVEEIRKIKKERMKEEIKKERGCRYGKI